MPLHICSPSIVALCLSQSDLRIACSTGRQIASCIWQHANLRAAKQLQLAQLQAGI